jgi:hypothetical protein
MECYNTIVVFSASNVLADKYHAMTNRRTPKSSSLIQYHQDKKNR